MLIFINSAISMLNMPAEEILRQLDIVLPQEVATIFSEYIDYIGSLQSETLLYAGLFLTVYMLSRCVNSLMRSVKIAYHMEKNGPFYFLKVVVFSVLLLVSLLILLVVLTVNGDILRKLQQYIALSPTFISLWQVLSYTLVPAYTAALLTTFYYIVGERRFSFWQCLPGALFFMVIWVVATTGFSYYIANMARYSVLYGSIGAIMILMLWLYITGVVLILGGELNCVLAEEIAERKVK